MSAFVKVQCPDCDLGFNAKFSPDIRMATLCCPNCKKTHPFNEFKIMDDGVQDRERIGQITYWPNDNSGQQSTYQLSEGELLIGRRCHDHLSKLELVDATKTSSRKHLKILVNYIEMRGYVYRVSLATDNNPNITTFNGRTMVPGEVYIAHNGDTIELPSHTIRFENL